MSLGIKKSSFRFLNMEYDDIILEIRPGAFSLPSEPRSVRQTIVFRDFSKLQCHEIIDANGEIESYYYNWNDSNGNLIMKFHAHFHPAGTPYEIARFDPFHTHKKEDQFDEHGNHRESNNAAKDLYTILYVIKQALYVRSTLR
ncbi:DUF6516 family protein [Paenibacillus dendritiformis]|uniref:toxin-antitoxin system TumE family protein n=1 Tax=Paenibacillus dendritiformis TaxID=130049 RepID=UPI00248CDBE8|nr:DUF6516 family protein [Paenibacillus dendritiformis]WGU93395.1 DUF6516 family protein [Paenibacillus dendritiformis]